jgi:Tol biopolymer transport system component
LLGLVAAFAWLAGAWFAWRRLGWFPPRVAQIVLLFGWVPFLAAGIASARLRSQPVRRAASVAVVVAALLVPVMVTSVVPGLVQPRQYPLPGDDWEAVVASPDGTSDLYLVRGQAGGLVAYGETPWVELWADLSPDHRHIVVSAARYGSDDLFVVDLDAQGNATATRRLTDAPGNEDTPVWSPDGSRIAFTDSVPGSATIATIDADGGAPTHLTSHGFETYPSWSPDGSRIAFSSPARTDAGNLDIWIMDADGSHPQDSIDATATDWWPIWSPDGTTIAFAGLAGSRPDVFVAAPDGGSARNLTGGSPGLDQPYAWPTADGLLFTSDRSNTGGTFLYAADPAAAGGDVRLVLRI